MLLSVSFKFDMPYKLRVGLTNTGKNLRADNIKQQLAALLDAGIAVTG